MTINLNAASQWTIPVEVGNDTIKIDVYEAWSRLASYRRSHDPESETLHDYYAGAAKALDGLGLPPLNLKQTEIFIGEINRVIGELEKKAEVATGSPAESRDSTGSTPSTGLATS